MWFYCLLILEFTVYNLPYTIIYGYNIFSPYYCDYSQQYFRYSWFLAHYPYVIILSVIIMVAATSAWVFVTTDLPSFGEPVKVWLNAILVSTCTYWMIYITNLFGSKLLFCPNNHQLSDLCWKSKSSTGAWMLSIDLEVGMAQISTNFNPYKTTDWSFVLPTCY